jgi:hypothetical protein
MLDDERLPLKKDCSKQLCFLDNAQRKPAGVVRSSALIVVETSP